MSPSFQLHSLINLLSVNMAHFSLFLVLALGVVGSLSDSVIPGRKHNILIDSEGNGAFDLYFNTESGAKIGCRGSILNGHETLQEIYYEDDAGLHRDGKVKSSKMRILVVPGLSKGTSNSSIETLGLAKFAFWPRECILGLIQHNIQDLLAEESHEDIKTGVVSKTNYLVQEASSNNEKDTKELLIMPWWMALWTRNAMQAFETLMAKECDRQGGGCGCDECNSCSKCAGWGPVIGGTNNSPQCTYIDINVSRGGGSGGGGVRTPQEKNGSDEEYSNVYVSVGGGGGLYSEGTGGFGGHGGNVAGTAISSIYSDGNSGIYSCNDDNMTINGIVYSGGTNEAPTQDLKQASAGYGHAKKLI